MAETIRKYNEHGSTWTLSMKNVEINKIKGTALIQRLLLEKESLIIILYYLEYKETLYLLTFFMKGNKRPEYKDLVKEIAYSFTLSGFTNYSNPPQN